MFLKQNHDRQMIFEYVRTPQNINTMALLQTVLSQYHPTLLFPFNHLRMVLSFISLANTDHLTRQLVNLPDGEVISLDWLPSDRSAMDETTPVIVVFPGLTSDSSTYYANVFLDYAVNDYGFRACIVNRRGYAKMKFSKQELDPITWDKFQDLDEIIKVIEKDHPKANIYLAGMSMGANHIQKYAGIKGQTNTPINVKALGCVSSPYCLVEAAKHIKSGYITNKAIIKSLLATFEAHLGDDRFQQALKSKNIKPETVLGSQSSDEFNEHFSIKFTTHSNVDAYKRSVSSSGFIRHIQVPTLAINSKNDLIAPFAAIPFDEIRQNDKFIQIAVNGGGHLEFFSRYYLRRWAFDVILNFFKIIENEARK